MPFSHLQVFTYSALYLQPSVMPPRLAITHPGGERNPKRPRQQMEVQAGAGSFSSGCLLQQISHWRAWKEKGGTETRQRRLPGIIDAGKRGRGPTGRSPCTHLLHVQYTVRCCCCYARLAAHLSKKVPAKKRVHHRQLPTQ